MTPSAAQPETTASAIRSRMATVIALPVRFLTSVYLLTAAVNSKAPGARQPARPRALPTGRGEPADLIQLVTAVLWIRTYSEVPTVSTWPGSPLGTLYRDPFRELSFKNWQHFAPDF